MMTFTCGDSVGRRQLVSRGPGGDLGPASPGSFVCAGRRGVCFSLDASGQPRDELGIQFSPGRHSQTEADFESDQRTSPQQ